MPIITDTSIAAAARRAKTSGNAEVLKDPDQTGLQLRVAPSGVRTWRLQCRDAAGRPRRYTLGEYPGLGLAQARLTCRATREQVRQGADPIAEAGRKRKAAEQARRGENTLGALVAIYERAQGGKLRGWADYRRRIECVFGKHLARPLTELTLQDLQQCADTWPSGQSAASATRYLRPVMKWASHPGRAYVARELALIEPPAAVIRRQRVLSPEELAALLPVLRGSSSAYAAGLEFILLTACRRDEAASAVWRDVDLAGKLWRIPQTKMGREHTVPLSRQAVALLEARLPGGAAGADALVFTGEGAKLNDWDRATRAVMRDSGTAGWHRHDLRRTAATMLGRMGIDPHVVEAALGHVAIHSQLAATYNTARYLPQVAEALQRLADALDLIADGGAKVVQLIRCTAAAPPGSPQAAPRGSGGQDSGQISEAG